MNITETFTATTILMEGDAITEVSEPVVVESIVLFDDQEFTPMFDPMFKPDYTETLIIAPPEFEEFKSPEIFNRHGRQTWMC
jgi:hypothetical protein